MKNKNPFLLQIFLICCLSSQFIFAQDQEEKCHCIFENIVDTDEDERPDFRFYKDITRMVEKEGGSFSEPCPEDPSQCDDQECIAMVREKKHTGKCRVVDPQAVISIPDFAAIVGEECDCIFHTKYDRADANDVPYVFAFQDRNVTDLAEKDGEVGFNILEDCVPDANGKCPTQKCLFDYLCANSPIYRKLEGICVHEESDEDKKMSWSGEAEQSDQSISIFPNPANQSVVIAGGTLQTIEILNLSGQVVMEQNFANTKIQHELDVSALSKGLYMVRVNSLVVRQLAIHR